MLLVTMVGWCKMKYYLLETLDGSNISYETFNARNTEYGNNYMDYYYDYQVGMYIAYKAIFCVCFNVF